jgi:hypothetical protein
LIDRSENSENLPHDEGRQPERGLVEEQEPRAQHQRPGHREHLLLAPRKRTGGLATPLAQHREVPEHALEVVLEIPALSAAPRPQAQVLLDREVHEGAAALGRVRDSELHDVLGSLALERLVLEANRAGRANHA